MRNKWLLLTIFLIGSIALQPALAKKHHKKQEVRGVVVSSVDAANNKIALTVEHNMQVTDYLVPLGTAITIDGGAAKLSDVSKGMYVRSYTEGDAGDLSQLDVTHSVVK